MSARVLSLPFLALLSISQLAFGQLNPPQFISLVPPNGLAHLDAKYHLGETCPHKAKADAEKCKAEKLKPQSWVLNAYEAPNKESRHLGKLAFNLIPSKGISAVFVDAAKKSVPVKSDSTQGDWGYGAFFEFTVNNVQGDWIQLPKRPFAQPIWVNLKQDWGKDVQRPQKLETGIVYTSAALGNIVITKFSGRTFSYRAENANDMLCGAEPEKIRPAQLKETTKPVDVLFDKDGHLTTWLTHTHGC